MLLVELFIRDEQKYNARVSGGSKKGLTPRQKCIDNWQQELAAIGCDRTADQIGARIKGDIVAVRALHTTEKAERGKTGGGVSKKSQKLDLARKKLYEHFAGSHVVEGLKEGFESGGRMEQLNVVLEDGIRDTDVLTCSAPQLSSTSSRSSGSLTEFSASSQTVPAKSKTFADHIKNSTKRRAAPFTIQSEFSESRKRLIEAEIDVATKKSRNLDEKYEQLLMKSSILEKKEKLMAIELELARARASAMGIES